MKKKSSICSMKRNRTIKTFIIFIAVGLNLNLLGNNSSDLLQLPYYPKYKEVVLKLLEDYSIADAQLYPYQFSMAKKPDGWHATIKNNLKNEIVKDELFWDRQNNEYLKVDFPESIMYNSAKDHQKLIHDWQYNYFTEILPYWGYAGWDKDIITGYEKEINLSDTLLNALARAYSGYASNLLNNTTGFSLEEDRFDLPYTLNALSEEQLSVYREYQHKAIDTYHKLWKINPEFETFVAGAYNVYSNEVMCGFLTLLYHQNREEAEKELKKGLYDSFFVDMAKRFLASCDSNAILFVNGDNDTYPLLYVQETEGYRTDVTVINIPMLGNPRYVSHLFYENSYASQPIQCTMDKEIYKKGTKQFFYVNKEQEKIAFSDMIEFVSSKGAETKLKIQNNYYNYIPSKKILLRKGRSARQTIDTTFIVNLKEDYLYANLFCLLDIIGTNGFERPVNFAITVAQDYYLSLSDYFLCEGLTYKINPSLDEAPEDNYVTGYIDTEIQYDKLMKEQENYRTVSPQKYSEAHKKMVSNYRFSYSRLAKKLIEENKKKKALKVLDYINSEFPFDKIEPGYFSLSIIESYYKLNKKQEANEIVRMLMIAILEDKVGKLQALSIGDYETRLMIEILRQLEDITTRYVEDSVINQDVRKKYYLVIDNVGKK